MQREFRYYNDSSPSSHTSFNDLDMCCEFHLSGFHTCIISGCSGAMAKTVRWSFTAWCRSMGNRSQYENAFTPYPPLDLEFQCPFVHTFTSWHSKSFLWFSLFYHSCYIISVYFVIFISSW